MARPKKRKPAIPDGGFTVVAVRWDDAYSRTRDKLPDDETSPTLTVGMIIRETETSLFICHEIDRPDSDDDKEVEYDFTRVPKVLILDQQILGQVLPLKEVEDASP